MAAAHTSSSSTDSSRGVKTSVAIICMVLVLLAGYVIGTLRPFDEKETKKPTHSRSRVPIGTAAVRGPATAKVTIVEFSDYECPFCEKAENTMQELLKAHPNEVRLVFKHAPLSMHQNAVPAARAAMAAREQGNDAFWKFHALLFKNRQNLPGLVQTQFESLAKEAGLNVAKFKLDLSQNASRYDAQIESDQAEAKRLGVTGTPSFFVNGRSVKGAQPIEEFQKLIAEETEAANRLLKNGVPISQLYDLLTQEERTGTEPLKPKRLEPAAAKPKAPEPTVDPNTIYKVLVEDSPVKGDKNAKVTIVEFSDFQCPYCSRVVSTLQKILETYSKDVRVVFKQYPLSFHENAELAAAASLAAHAQGKFWPMHDKLFANQKFLDRPSLEKYAQELKLNMRKFNEALNKEVFKAKINAETAQGTKVGVQGTPAFFVNGRFLKGAQPFENFKTYIDRALAEADVLMKAKRIKANKVYDELMKTATEAVKTEPAKAGTPAEVAGLEDRTVYQVEPGDGPTWGDPKAAVTITEFSDFQCPYCARVLPTLAQIKQKYADKVRIVWRNYPLPVHAEAGLAAEAALAAHAQGKFWPMHDKLFANQRFLDRASLEKYAQEIGLDMNKFKADLDSHRYAEAVRTDFAYGNKVSSGGLGTPAFFVNGQKIEGAYPFATFEKAIQNALTNKK